MNDTEIYYVILKDIEEKHVSKKPVFKIGGSIVTEKEKVIEYIGSVMEEGKWILYKIAKEGTFELKGYFPRPLSGACLGQIDSAFDTIQTKRRQIIFRFGDVFLNKEEARQELFIGMKEGSSEISVVESDAVSVEGKVYDISLQDTEVYWQIQSGYLFLEYKDSYTYDI